MIPVLNAVETLGDQLSAILNQPCSGSIEVVVADNGSTDGTLEVVRSFVETDARVRLVDASDRALGGAAAKNAGVEAARGDLIAFADADDLVADGWLEAAYQGLQEHQVVSFTREYWRLNPKLPRTHFPEKNSDYWVMGLPLVSGGAFGIQRELYQRLGGFDERMEGAVDSEFGVRLYRDSSTRPVGVDAVVHVRVPIDPLQRLRRKRALASSRALMVARHRPVLPVSRRPLAASLVGWIRLAASVWMLASTGGRLVWAGRLGTRLGSIDGYRRHGVLVP